MSPAIAVRPLTLDDVPYGLTLSTAAKWNQTTRDWRRVVEWQPDGCFVGVVDGRDAGTITTCQFGPVAWIGLLLVDADYRGRGLGRALLEYALQWLDAHGSTTIRLDATPLGQPLYERLGFTADFELLRFAGHPSRTAALQDARGAVSVRPMTIDDRAEVVRLDEQVTGTARGELLSRLDEDCHGAGRIVRRGDRTTAYRLERHGRVATQLGPCGAEADDPSAGAAILSDALLERVEQPVYVDVPSGHVEARRLVEAAGLVVQRSLLRMTRGQAVVERPSCLWASSGPEKG